MNIAQGTRLGPYEVMSRLGAGGMGVVYTARDPRLKRQVAIKLLSPDLTRDDVAKRRFLQEAQAASALDHPNICNIHEINEAPDGQLYLVMAYYAGATLKQRIDTGSISIDEAVDIARQVADGLATAHDAGIVHRDIKPANLLIAKSGVVKILDFGLAKLTGSEGVTQTGTTVGTVAYMSPEQARGEEVDHRTDIWSLGAVLYEMVAGTTPFHGDNLLALSSAIADSEPRALSGQRADVPAQVDRVVSQALSKRKEERQQSARAGDRAARRKRVPGRPTARRRAVDRRPAVRRHERQEGPASPTVITSGQNATTVGWRTCSTCRTRSSRRSPMR